MDQDSSGDCSQAPSTTVGTSTGEALTDVSADPRHCLNCGAVLQGDWCHACGQSVKSMVRDLGSVLVDVVDTLLIYDKRIWRTLVPLYLRPGFISNDFVAGRRARYVPPFRLFFVLSLVTFLALQFLTNPQEMFNLRDEVQLDEASEGPADEAADSPLVFGLGNLDEEEWQVQFNWLPAAANQQLNIWLQQAVGNVERVGEDPGRLADSMFNLLPLVLFVLMPVFAMLLKILYLFRRRLYMEHLLVALHSHAFLFIAILICIAVGLLAGATSEIPLVGGASGLLFELSQLWIPVYLLLMQKFVYRQGWLMTISKYLLLGIIYCTMILFAVVGAVLVSLINF